MNASTGSRGHSSLGPLPESQERGSDAFRLDPMRRIEMVAFGERLEGEVWEARSKTLSHAGVVVGIAATAEREVHGLIERPKRFDVEVAAIERADQRPYASGPLRHPWRRRAARWGRWLYARRELQPHERRHQLIGREAFDRTESLPQSLLLYRPLIACPRWFQERQASESLAVLSGGGQRGCTTAGIADEVEPVEAVTIGLSQNPLHLHVEAVVCRRLIPGIHLQVLRDRINPIPEHLEECCVGWFCWENHTGQQHDMVTTCHGLDRRPSRRDALLDECSLPRRGG